MSDLEEFLLNRIDETEDMLTTVTDEVERLGSVLVDARKLVVVDAEAKRRIVLQHRPELEMNYRTGRLLPTGYCSTCARWEFDVNHGGPPHVKWPCPTILALARPYVHHPEFQEAWR